MLTTNVIYQGDYIKILLFLLIILPSAIYADENQQGSFTKCTSGYELSVGAYNDVQKSFGNYNNSDLSENLKFQTFGDDEGNTTSCIVGEKEFKISFHIDSYRERGPCAAAPGGFISLNINGENVTNNITYNIDCYNALDGLFIRTYSGKKEHLTYRFCGHVTKGATFSDSVTFDGCVEYDEKHFLRLLSLDKKLSLLELFNLSK